MRSAVLSCTLIAVGVSACGGPDALSLAVSDPGLGQCAVRAEGSRWVGYEALAMAGEWKGDAGRMDVRGVGTTGADALLVFDGFDRRVVVLDTSLTPVGELGGRNGPIAAGNLRSDNWLAVHDTLVDVFDGTRVHRFTVGGAYLGARGDTLPAVNLIGLAPADSLTFYALDDRDMGSGARALVTGIFGDEMSQILWRVAMPDLPGADGSYFLGTNHYQAQPLWAAQDGCVYVSDGSSPWLLRFRAGTGAVDTIPLPNVEPPAETDLDREYQRSRLERGRALAPRSVPDSLTPTARIRWAGISIDPDGWVWIEPWRPISSRAIPFRAVVVNPETGQADGPVVPEFPRAFGPGGKFYVVGLDPATVGPLLRSYVPAPNVINSDSTMVGR